MLRINFQALRCTYRIIKQRLSSILAPVSPNLGSWQVASYYRCVSVNMYSFNFIIFYRYCNGISNQHCHSEHLCELLFLCESSSTRVNAERAWWYWWGLPFMCVTLWLKRWLQNAHSVSMVRVTYTPPILYKSRERQNRVGNFWDFILALVSRLASFEKAEVSVIM